MNELTQYFIPQWITITFFCAIPFPFILLILFVRREAAIVPRNSAAFYVTSFFILYLSYIVFVIYNGWINQISFPPKVLLYCTFPYSTLLFLIVTNTNLYKSIIATCPIQNLIRLHIFRVIGIFFILLAIYDALPRTFAFIAGCGDIITAVGSVFVASAVDKKKSYAGTLVYAWNIFGFSDIIFTAVAANVLTKISMETGSMGVDTLAVFPFCIIPAFAPPTILLLHLAIFQQLRRKSI